MLSWQTLVPLPPPELAQIDIAAKNLACAEGLPGANQIDWDRIHRTLDDMRDSCRRFTTGMMPHFHAGRCDFPESERKFRTQVMVTHLQRDLGVKYHPDRIAANAVFQTEDSFLHGALFGAGGTCGNLPVLYAAVGRRLGYPIMLAHARGHLYCRWDGGIPEIETFNIEASGHGVSFFPDEHYRSGRYELPPGQAEACGYGRTLDPREELAGFLCQRGICWAQLGNHAEAVIAFAWAHELDPRPQHVYCTQEGMRLWRAAQHARFRDAQHFPKLDLGLPAPHFTRMPREAERQLMGLAATQRLLDDPRLDARWWQPLRLNPTRRPLDLPIRISVDFRWASPGRWVTISPHLTEG